MEWSAAVLTTSQQGTEEEVEAPASRKSHEQLGQCWNLNPDSLALESVPLTTTHTASQVIGRERPREGNGPNSSHSDRKQKRKWPGWGGPDQPKCPDGLLNGGTPPSMGTVLPAGSAVVGLHC